MRRHVEFADGEYKELKIVSKRDALRIMAKCQAPEDDLEGGVKRLTNHDPAYRLRVGNYRALFDVVGNRVVSQRVLHRKEASD